LNSSQRIMSERYFQTILYGLSASNDETIRKYCRIGATKRACHLLIKKMIINYQYIWCSLYGPSVSTLTGAEGGQLSLRRSATEGVMQRTFCADYADGASLSDKPSGAAGSAHTTAMSVLRAIKAISASVICLKLPPPQVFINLSAQMRFMNR